MRPESLGPTRPEQEVILTQDTKKERELVFTSIILNELRETIKTSLLEVGCTEEEIGEFFTKLEIMKDEDALAALAIPLELQERLCRRLAERLHQGKTTMSDFLHSLYQNAQEKKYQLGFHASNTDIQPTVKINRQGQTVTKWDIIGKEPDHRDDDLPKAYYSLDYLHLYRKKHARYLYLVRGETGHDTAHRQDNDGGWGRATHLSIIARLDLREVDQYIEDHLKQKNSSKNEEAA